MVLLAVASSSPRLRLATGFPMQPADLHPGLLPQLHLWPLMCAHLVPFPCSLRRLLQRLLQSPGRPLRRRCLQHHPRLHSATSPWNTGRLSMA